MKKSTLLLGLALLTGLSDSAAQKQFPLHTTTDSLRFRVSQQDGRLRIEPLGAPRQEGRAVILEIQLDDADLVVVCAAEAGSGEKGSLPVQYAISLHPEGGGNVQPRTIEENISARRRQIRWPDLAETTLELGQTYTLVVQKSTLGLVDCSAPRPVFTPRNQLPYFAVAGAGLAAVGIGQLYNSRKKADYEAYLRLWREGGRATDAQPFFDAAQKNERISRILTISGLAVIAADAVFFNLHLFNLKRKQKIYDRFCPENTAPPKSSKSTSMIRIYPFTEMAQPGGDTLAGGFCFSFKF